MDDSLAVYQSRHVTPYMHSFISHVPEFLTLYGNLTQFTQQGMEELNDTSTKYYFRAMNHHKILQPSTNCSLKGTALKNWKTKGILDKSGTCPV